MNRQFLNKPDQSMTTTTPETRGVIQGVSQTLPVSTGSFHVIPTAMIRNASFQGIVY